MEENAFFQVFDGNSRLSKVKDVAQDLKNEAKDAQRDAECDAKSAA